MSLQNAFEDLATAANQDTEIASLASIDGKLPALDGGRIPVTLPATPTPVMAEDGSLLGTEDALREIMRALSYLPLMFEANNGATYAAGGAAMRVVWGAAHGLNNVNSVSSVTSMTNQISMGGTPANYDQYFQAWNYEATLIAKALA